MSSSFLKIFEEIFEMKLKGGSFVIREDGFVPFAPCGSKLRDRCGLAHID